MSTDWSETMEPPQKVGKNSFRSVNFSFNMRETQPEIGEVSHLSVAGDGVHVIPPTNTSSLCGVKNHPESSAHVLFMALNYQNKISTRDTKIHSESCM